MYAAGGNAGDASYRANLVKLGYVQFDGGITTKAQIINVINTTKWNVGDIINYRSIISVGGNNYANIYGHTQIYTGGVLKTSNNSPWASSFGNNYGVGFVYGRANSDQWEYFIFRKK